MSEKAMFFHEDLCTANLEDGTKVVVQLPTPSAGIVVCVGKERYALSMQEIINAALNVHESYESPVS